MTLRLCAGIIAIASLGATIAPSDADIRRPFGHVLTPPPATLPAGTGTFVDRWDPNDVRLLTWNTQGTFIADSSRDAAYDRVLSAVDPDIIVFTEIPSNAIEGQIAGWLSSRLGGTWHILGGLPTGIRTVVASRFSLSLQAEDTIPASSTRGVTMALADLPNGTYTHDLYILGVHLKCCGGADSQEKRQRSADAIASWMGDARQPGGNITLSDNTPMVIFGDFNLVGDPQPELTLLTGDIQDEGTFGSDVKGDWDVTNITDLIPIDTHTGNTNTWPSTSSPSSRLDRFMYTDSAVSPANSFILNSNTMTSAERAATGINASDTTENATADHLPIVMDITLESSFADCNNNGVPDAQDISDGTSEDCNGNGNPDECDIAEGSSLDADEDGIPDECQIAAAVVLNEILADPAGSQPDDLEGDANNDGIRDTFDDEFVEIVNVTGSAIDMSTWQLWDGTTGGSPDQLRHLFPPGTIVEDQCGIVVFGGGTPTGPFGDMIVQTASTGQLSLRNSADTITLFNHLGDQVAAMTHTGASNNTSLNLDPDVTGIVYVRHDLHPDSGGSLFSPGTRMTSSSFTGCGVIPVGACCFGETCLEMTSTDCTNGGGTYFGDGSGCTPTPCEPACPGDCGTEDGTINVADLLELLAQWGGSGSCDIAPGSGDGVVDVVDLLGLLEGWGPCP